MDKWKESWKPLPPTTFLCLKVPFPWTPMGGRWARVGVFIPCLARGRTSPKSRVPERAQEVGGNSCRQLAGARWQSLGP